MGFLMKKKILYFALVPFLLLLQNNQLYAMKRQRNDDTHLEPKPIKKNKFLCSHCNLSCTSRCQKVTHERTHTGEKPFPCTQCPMAFVRTYALKQHHIKVHTIQRQFQCTQCSSSYGREGDLTNHITKIHTAKESLPRTRRTISLPQQNHPTNNIKKNLVIVTTTTNVPQQEFTDLFTHQSDPFKREYIAWFDE